MNRQLKTTYHYHSGFSVQVGSILLIFDYWEGENRSLSQVGRMTSSFMGAFEHVYVFISHAHPDHLDPIVYEWEKEGVDITYIISSDMPDGIEGIRIAPLEAIELSNDMMVKAYQSTDLGVAFMVKVFDICIFHAGDLNFWHWRQESSLSEIRAAEDAFYQAVESIEDITIDVAMFPLDPRQGLMYDAGANHFIMTKKPRVFIPMHWQEREEVSIEFSRRGRTKDTEVLPLVKPGVVANIIFEEDRLDIHIIEPPKDMNDLPIMPERSLKYEDQYQGDVDPFEDSDLPVQI